VKYVLIYDSADDVRTKAPPQIPAHSARLKEFHAKGVLLMGGVYDDLSGAITIFTTPEAAEEFARDDPFVTQGVVKGWRVIPWREALTP
jgi:hypothetical protein